MLSSEIHNTFLNSIATDACIFELPPCTEMRFFSRLLHSDKVFRKMDHNFHVIQRQR